MCGRFALVIDGEDLADLLASQNLRNHRQASEDQEDGEQSLIQGDKRAEGNQAPEQHRDDGGESSRVVQPMVRWVDDAAPQKVKPRYNIAPQTQCLVLRRNESSDKEEYLLSFMKWGLIPSWTKRPPDSASALKTINCRDDTLFSGTGLWSGIRGKKRCVIVASGFYEWLSKKGTKQKIPHFTKMGNGSLMVMAGLWDSVTYPTTKETVESFTIITTSSSKYLAFLHDRMPALLCTPSAIATWLAPTPGLSWTPELQKLIAPFEGNLECYPVPTEVGKVGNESSDFVRPVKERKGNLASMFQKQAEKISPTKPPPTNPLPPTPQLSSKPAAATQAVPVKLKREAERKRSSSVEIVEAPSSKKLKML